MDRIGLNNFGTKENKLRKIKDKIVEDKVNLYTNIYLIKLIPLPQLQFYTINYSWKIYIIKHTKIMFF